MLCVLMQVGLTAATEINNDEVLESAFADLMQTICTTVGRFDNTPFSILQSIQGVLQEVTFFLITFLPARSYKFCFAGTRCLIVPPPSLMGKVKNRHFFLISYFFSLLPIGQRK